MFAIVGASRWACRAGGRKLAQEIWENSKSFEAFWDFLLCSNSAVSLQMLRSVTDTIVCDEEAVTLISHSRHFMPRFTGMTVARKKIKRQALPARSWTCRCSCGPARRRWGCCRRAPWWRRRGLSQAGVWVQLRSSSSWKSIHATSELLRRPPPTRAFLYTQVGSTVCRPQNCSKRELKPLVGNTFGQLVPTSVFSSLSLNPIFSLYFGHNADHLPCSTPRDEEGLQLCTFHSSREKDGHY